MATRQGKASFDAELRRLIPGIVSEFPKLEMGHPYRFEHWSDDRSGTSSMYYWFDSHDGTAQHHKRLVVSEIHAALEHLLATGAFNRNAFRAHCPVSESSGPCGFVVVGRVLEALGVATYSGREKGFVKFTPTGSGQSLALLHGPVRLDRPEAG